MVDLNVIKQKIERCDFDRINYVYPSLPNDMLGQCISGFSNSGGGYILFGVHDDGDELKVKGFSADKNKMHKFIKSEFPGIKNILFHEFEHMGKRLYLIGINQGKTMISYQEKLYTMVKNERNRFVPEEIIKQRVFLSYCHKDKPLMKLIKSSLEKEPYIKLTVDEEQLDYKSDLVEFMKTIKNHDFAVAIISHSYLQSKNCMYEITELMKDDNYIEKLLFVILSDDERPFYDEEITQVRPNIYDVLGRLEYIEYWKSKQTELNDRLRSLEDLGIAPMLTNELNKMSIITNNSDKILDKLANQKGVSFNEMYKSGFNDMKEKILKRICKSNLQ